MNPLDALHRTPLFIASALDHTDIQRMLIAVGGMVKDPFAMSKDKAVMPGATCACAAPPLPSVVPPPVPPVSVCFRMRCLRDTGMPAEIRPSCAPQATRMDGRERPLARSPLPERFLRECLFLP